MNRIYGICLVKDEDDIVGETLTYATRYCDRIFVLDNGSTDDTWTIVQDLARRNDAIQPFQQTFAPFENGLRALVYNEVRGELSSNDWWLILDADEFLAEDPRPVLEAAGRTGADLVNTWQIQFFFTERDVRAWELGEDRRDRPIFDRRRHYLINWQESRLFRNDPRRPWDARVSQAFPEWASKPSRRRLMNRHYQYRDPEQMTKRLRLRFGQPLFPHVRTPDWRTMVRHSSELTCHREGAPWRFRWSGVWYFYRRRLEGHFRRPSGVAAATA